MGEIRNVFLALFILAFCLETYQGRLLAGYSLLGLSNSQIQESFQLQESHLEPNVARPHLDYEACALLHNRIVEIGWQGSYPDKDPSERRTVTWWEQYGEAAQNLSSPLAPSVVKFLEKAELPEDGLSFTFNLRGLSHPLELWNGLEGSDNEQTEIVLYSSSDQEGHGMGLVFNHELNLAVYSPTILEHSHSPALMFPLETALSMYLSMISTGKISATAEGTQNDQPYSKPWVWQYYCDMDVKAAVEEFTNLIDAIIDRTPVDQRHAVTEEYLHSARRSPLIDASTLHALNIPPSFLRQFLSQAPEPPFPFIAPGLTVPTRSALSRMFASYQVLGMYTESSFDSTLPPTLLFPSNVTLASPPNISLAGTFLFGDSQTTLDGVTSGLYIVSQSEHYEPFTNGVKLVLPFPLGANGFAKKANWEPIGSTWDHSQNYTDLYQMGSNSFIGNHAIMLHQVFQSWRIMIEEGIWEVDIMGVKGGMDAWKLADDAKEWWRFKMDDSLW